MLPVPVFRESPSADRQPGQPWPLRDAAKYLTLSERTLTRHHKAGKLKLILIGRNVYVPDDEMKRIATEGL